MCLPVQNKRWVITCDDSDSKRSMGSELKQLWTDEIDCYKERVQWPRSSWQYSARAVAAKIFPTVVLANTNIPENRFRICLEIMKLSDSSTEVFKKNMVDW